MSRLEEVASITNLHKAYLHCMKGKARSKSADHFCLELPDCLFKMRSLILSGNYPWLPHQPITVCDPKKREILVAPLRDRVVHQAISQVIADEIDKAIPPNSYACRKGMGNQKAVLDLFENLRNLGKQRFAVKLDVKKYFASIDHQVLMGLLRKCFADDQRLIYFFEGLVGSHKPYQELKKGIAIGSVTSQHFANLYLTPIDHMALNDNDVHYMRYMDDMLIVSSCKSKAVSLTHKVLEQSTSLNISIPPKKITWIGPDRIPFLGFLVSENQITPLARNKLRFKRKITKLIKSDAAAHRIAQFEASHIGWNKIETAVSSSGDR